MNMGYKLIMVFSDKDAPTTKNSKGLGGSSKPTLIVEHNISDPDQDRAIAQTLDAIRSQGAPVLAIIAGAEMGVDLADRLAARFGTRNNGEEKTEARRNKFLMQECIREAGVRAVKQQLCTTEDEVRAFYATLFATTETPAKCVVKPNQSAGSDSIFMCESVEATIEAFNLINGTDNIMGGMNYGALCQVRPCPYRPTTPTTPTIPIAYIVLRPLPPLLHISFYDPYDPYCIHALSLLATPDRYTHKVIKLQYSYFYFSYIVL